MLTETAIIQINKLLDLVDTYLLNQSEIDFLNKTGIDPGEQCEYYDAAQSVLTDRSKHDTRMNNCLETLKYLSELDGCQITLEPEVIPAVNIPFYGIGGDEL